MFSFLIAKKEITLLSQLQFLTFIRCKFNMLVCLNVKLFTWYLLKLQRSGLWSKTNTVKTSVLEHLKITLNQKQRLDYPFFSCILIEQQKSTSLNIILLWRQLEENNFYHNLVTTMNSVVSQTENDCLLSFKEGGNVTGQCGDVLKAGQVTHHPANTLPVIVIIVSTRLCQVEN